MKEWLQYAELNNCSADDPVLVINDAARICYNSNLPEEDRNKMRQFVLNLIHNEHETPLEFVTFQFLVVTDRGTSHELVRHRLASFQQQSTRYVKWDKGKVPFIMPTGMKRGSDEFAIWKEACERSEQAYFDLIDKGCKRQMARQVLNNSLATVLVMQMNLREFRHFLKLRMAKAAHPAMQFLALESAMAVLKEVPDANILLHGCFEDEQIRKYEDEQASKEGTDTPDGPAEPIRQELAKPLRWWRKLTGRTQR